LEHAACTVWSDNGEGELLIDAANLLDLVDNGRRELAFAQIETIL
jgi:hypothetical protein